MTAATALPLENQSGGDQARHDLRRQNAYKSHYCPWMKTPR